VTGADGSKRETGLVGVDAAAVAAALWPEASDEESRRIERVVRETLAGEDTRWLGWLAERPEVLKAIADKMVHRAVNSLTAQAPTLVNQAIDALEPRNRPPVEDAHLLTEDLKRVMAEKIGPEYALKVEQALQAPEGRQRFADGLATAAIATMAAASWALEAEGHASDEERERLTSIWKSDEFFEETLNWVSGPYANGRASRLEEHFGRLIRETVEQALQRQAEQAQGARRGALLTPFPADLHQFTFPELKAATSGAADGPSRRNWSNVEGENALRHGASGDPLEVKFVSKPLVGWLSVPDSRETLWNKLSEMGLQASMLFAVCAAAVLEQPLLTVTIDRLITEIGWGDAARRSTADRLRLRRQVWEWLAVYDSWRIIGRRKGTWRDPITHEKLDLVTETEIVHIGERAYAEGTQFALDADAVPSEVTLQPGPWLAKWRGDHRILEYFGDIRRIAAIPAGKPSGSWARAIGLALNQLWRERAAKAAVKEVGEDKHQTVRVGTFTRRQLLDLFPPDPSVTEVLAGDHPSRARAYWEQAIDLLKEEPKVIGYYREATPLKAGRKDWAEEWLNQKFDIRPAASGTAAIAEIAASKKSADRARTRRRKPPKEPEG